MTNNEETYKGKQALIIAGCRPPHIGHKDMVDQVEEQGFSKLIWIVGEYQSEPSFRNPFYGSERKEMTNAMLSEHSIDSIVVGLDDINNPPKYANYVISELEKNGVDMNEENTVIVSGNGGTSDCFVNYGHDYSHFKQQRRKHISATQVRTMIALDLPWRDYVILPVQEILDNLGAEERVKELYKLNEMMKTGEYVNPLPTADMIIPHEENGKKGVYLGFRKNDPKKWALPGGFMDLGETIEQAGIREVKEEFKVDVYDVKPFGWYSDPKRDPRGHMIAHVMIGKTDQKPRPGDDIEKVKFFLFDLIPEIMAFDHRKILDDYIARYETN